MRMPKISDFLRKITEFLPKENIERIVLKALFVLWIIISLLSFGLRIMKEKSIIAKKMPETAVKTMISVFAGSDEIKRYEVLLKQAQCPELMKTYSQAHRLDPFSKYVEESARIKAISAEHDFMLKSISNAPLPVIYKGFIELHDRIIGQLSWKDATRFVEEGASLDGYKILTIAKDRIEAVDEDDRKWEFLINKPVLSDKLNAVLYDKISKKTYTVETASIIDEYKVIDIQYDYVILLSKGVEIKLIK